MTSLTYSPNDISRIGTEYLDVRRTQTHQAIPFGIPEIDHDLLPLLPGELCTIIGRPGSAKTGVMMSWARRRAAWLTDNGYHDRIVVYASWEQSIEELYAFTVAAESGLSITEMARGKISDEDWGAILRSGSRRLSLPLWFIGHSAQRREHRPTLTIPNLYQEIKNIESWSGGKNKFAVDMVFADYLQRIPFEGRVESKTVGTSNTLDACKDGAIMFGCPWVVGCQAVREVDDRPDPTPQLSDGQWTSNVEIASDAVLSQVRPRQYTEEGERFPDKDGIVVKGYRQLLLSVLKRKLGKANWGAWLDYDPEHNELRSARLDIINTETW